MQRSHSTPPCYCSMLGALGKWRNNDNAGGRWGGVAEEKNVKNVCSKRKRLPSQQFRMNLLSHLFFEYRERFKTHKRLKRQSFFCFVLFCFERDNTAGGQCKCYYRHNAFLRSNKRGTQSHIDSIAFLILTISTLDTMRLLYCAFLLSFTDQS